MASRSFKQDLKGRPARYRTPSPPRDAFESISPTHNNDEDSALERSGMQWSNNSTHNNTRRHSDARNGVHKDGYFQRSESQGTMDAFASIALATGSTGPPQRPMQADHPARRDNLTSVSIDGQLERPAKRARSENLPSPELRRSSASKGSRPATTYEQSSDTRASEAELLVHFAQAARFAVPHQSNPRHDRTTSPELADFRQSTTLLAHEQDNRVGYHISPSGHHTSAIVVSGIELRDARQRATEANATPADAESTKPLERTDPTVQQSLLIPKATGFPTSEVVGPANDASDGVRNNKPADSEKAQNHKPLGEDAAPYTMDILAAEATSELVLTESPISPKLDQASVSTAVNIQEAGGVTSRGQEIGAEAGNTPGEEVVVPANFDPHKESEPGATLKAAIITQTTSSLSEQEGRPEPKQRDDTTTGADSIYHTEDNSPQTAAPAVCAACNFSRSTAEGETDNSSTSWICCDACKAWFHFACAGFKTEREVRGVDKYRCRKCKPSHGATTFVRKSARAHSAIDYAGLHQGVIKTSDETPEHHYIKPIKEGTITFLPETFARIRPELVTAEYFEKGYGWKEPIVVPAAWNPRTHSDSTQRALGLSDPEAKPSSHTSFGGSAPEEWNFADLESDFVPDHGQDALDMVMPKGLTVRAVAELYGPEEKVEVIDVKSQNGEGKKWNMRRWADYYESKDNKIVRNVISLEVSQSKLGRLIRRPQIVRDLDLQDSVWPPDLQAKGEIPRVQFYCLMSVADCFTDFHIDFGGSSVFYHILKGKKTFFFIPPKEKHLKKYEEWCLSPAQNWTFLGDQTKECYRVDLSEGDTMFIPAGWIHAVWTPEDSLVIGGNFLTRLNYGMQLRISQIEKATGVARKFRYPHFQKIHWYTAFRYLEDDPLPSIVQKLLQEGEIFYREKPAHHEFDDWGENSKSGLGNYHARYYSQAELEGLPDLTRYLLRTALIDLGSITEGITQETRNAVKRSIPRGHGEPLEVVKKFAAWCAWKRGNETIPSWAYPGAIPEPESVGKLSAAAQKKLDREAALQAPRRQSARKQSQLNPLNTEGASTGGDAQGLDSIDINTVNTSDPAEVGAGLVTPTKRKLSDSSVNGQLDMLPTVPKKRRTTSGTGSNPHRKVACESCRKRRRACKHKDTRDVLYPDSHTPASVVDAAPSIPGPQIDALVDFASSAGADSVDDSVQLSASGKEALASIETDTPETPQDVLLPPEELQAIDPDDGTYLLKSPDEIASTPKMLTHLSGAGLLRLEHRIAGGPVNGLSVLSLNAPHSRGRTKACNDCRKSKRRCIHDEYGNEDPVKAREAAIPRPAAANKRRKVGSDGIEIPSAKRSRKSSTLLNPLTRRESMDPETPSKAPLQQAPTANMAGAATAAMIQHPPRAEAHPPDQDDMMLSAFDQIQAAAESMYRLDPHLEQIQSFQRDESALNRPASAACSDTTFAEKVAQGFFEEASANPQENVHTVPCPTPSMKVDYPIDPALEHMSSSFSVPAASLVSPPASSHADAGQTPHSPSANSSRHTSQNPKQMQGFTPESGPRRDSSSSVDELPPTSNDGRAGSAVSEAVVMGKDTSPMTTISTAGEDERKVGAPRRKSRGSMDNGADEESLKLIKELQAQDYGLRRRGKA